jgi:O-antigen/teichoic acid export membrane protein
LKLSALTARFLGNRDTSAVFRGMATLALGSGLARVIGIVSIPILTRLYTPEDFGVMAVFVALVAILAPLLTLRYVLALPLPRHDGLAMNLMALSAGLMLIIGTLLAIGLALFAEPVLALMSMEVLAPWWWLIVLALIGSGTYEMLSLWATRRRAYKAIARTQVTQSAAGAMVKIGFGAFGAGPIGLLVGQVVAQSGGIGMLLRQFRNELRANWRHVRRSRLERVAIRHRGFPIYRLPSQFLLVFSQQAPLLLVAVFFDAATAGQFALALAVVAAPVGLFSGSIAKAYFAEIAQMAARPSALLQLSKSVFKRVAMISVPLTIGVAILSPFAFPWIFGGEWQLAGLLAAILAISIIPNFLGQTIIQSLTVTSRNHVFFFYNVSRALVVVVSLMLPAWAGLNILWVIFTYVVALSIQRIFQVLLIFRMLKADADLQAQVSNGARP